MPMLDAAQAQKHVTVNEALVRADILGARRVEARDLSSPPPAPADGEAWIVAPGATGEWSNQDGSLALFLNGGWTFVAPWRGACFWVHAEQVSVTFVADNWQTGHVAGAPGGASSFQRIIEIDHAVSSGVTSNTAAVIPDKAIVLGVTSRVIAQITGVTGWSLGVSGAADRYGSGYGTAVNSFAIGVTGQPQTYYGTTALQLSAEGGSFTGGSVRVAIHFSEIAPPAAV
jgi:hypothetical protein